MNFEKDNKEARRRAIQTIRRLDYSSTSRYNGSYAAIYKSAFLPFSDYMALEKLKLVEEKARNDVEPPELSIMELVNNGTCPSSPIRPFFQPEDKIRKRKQMWQVLSSSVWQAEGAAVTDKVAHLQTIENALRKPEVLLGARQAQMCHVQDKIIQRLTTMRDHE